MPDELNSNDCLIAFGSNEGESQLIFDQAVHLLCETKQCDEIVTSERLKTRPIGGPSNQNNYLNACIRLRTKFTANDLFTRLMEIESQLGRQRRGRWGSRIIDLDLLLFGCEQIKDLKTSLEVPHPRMTFRRFVLQPAVEIAADMVHPITKMMLGDLLKHIDSPENSIRLITNQPNDYANRLEAFCTDQDWGYRVCSPGDQAAMSKFAKLNVYFAPEAGVIETHMAGIGPLLKLQPDRENIRVELLAAIDAMNTC